jgi:hypothetical protein
MSKESRKFCPKCALENIKTELKLLPNNILSCPIGHWVGKQVEDKLVETFNCPRCALENIKSELQNYPNHLLTCRNCQWIRKEIGGRLVESVL